MNQEKEAPSASILTFPVSRRATWRRLVRATRDDDTERLVQQEVRRLKNRDVAAEVGEKIEKLEKRAFTAIEKQRSDIKQIFEELGTLKVLVGRLDERSQSGGRGH